MSHTSAEEQLEELARRVENLESAQAIAKVHQQYIRDLAARNWSGVADAYSDDAVCDIRHHGVHVGREAITSMFDNELLPFVHSKDGYILSSPEIDADGDTAVGTWTWHRLQADFKTALGVMRIWGPWSEGRYEASYRRENGQWKISKLWFRVHAPDHDDDIIAARENGQVVGGGLGRS